MPRNEDYDWIFDFTLQFLESDQFDCTVMDFVDENCHHFDENDENKLIYTTIHNEFVVEIESLLTTSLAEVGITMKMFLESCELARGGRDINSTVYERLIAMDDFQTFKKIMIKRNTELQLEALHSIKGSGGSGRGEEMDLLSPEELQVLKELERFEMDKELQDDELQDLLFQSLMEMEIIHRQEELEHAELERALRLSLLAEEERVDGMMAGMKKGMEVADAKAGRDETPSKDTPSYSASSAKASAPSTPAAAALDAKSSPKKHLTPVAAAASASSFGDIKPLRTHTYAPLPSISGGSGGADLQEKKRLYEDTMKKAAEQLAGQRRNEEELRQQIGEVDPVEAERRARHLQQQRDLLIAKKKAERDARAAASGKANSAQQAESDSKPSSFASPAKASKDTAEDRGANHMRANMHMALARRMKIDLMESEEAKLAEAQESQFAEYDRKLQQVEQNREDNRKREYLLSKQLAKQQEQIVRNMKLSAAALGGGGSGEER